MSIRPNLARPPVIASSARQRRRTTARNPGVAPTTRVRGVVWVLAVVGLSLVLLGGLVLILIPRSAAADESESASNLTLPTEPRPPQSFTPQPVPAALPPVTQAPAPTLQPTPPQEPPVNQTAQQPPRDPGPSRKDPPPAINDDTCGTSVHFVMNPIEASRRAANGGKLLFLLHVSGNFEDSGFT